MNHALRLGVLLLACVGCLAQTSKAGGSMDTLNSKLEEMPEFLEGRSAVAVIQGWNISARVHFMYR